MFLDPVAYFLTYPIIPKSHMTKKSKYMPNIPYILPIYIPYMIPHSYPLWGFYIYDIHDMWFLFVRDGDFDWVISIVPPLGNAI